jgi:hypothetical protein
MTFDLYDSGGYAGPGPSITGLKDLKAALKQRPINPAVYPQMSRLLREGYSESPIRLKYEAMALQKQVNDPLVKHTLMNISKAAANAADIVIIHNHLS